MKQYLIETKDHNGGVQKVYNFPNGYGASVIRHLGSYGYKKGFWELAVLRDGQLCYDTEVTNDVIGNLNDPEVDQLLGQISRLS